MNNTGGQLQDLAEKIFSGYDQLEQDQDKFSEALWKELELAQLTELSKPERLGGSGGTLGDAAGILWAAGRHAAPVPLAETGFLAGWALSASRAPIPESPMTVGPVRAGDFVEVYPEGSGWRLRGRLNRVPWARVAKNVVLIGQRDRERVVANVKPEACEITLGENLVGEARDDLRLDGVWLSEDNVVPAGDSVNEGVLRRRGALARAIMMAGALERVLELSVTYARERHQFGRPIGKFQAIQQQLATLAGEVAAAGAVVEAAIAALERSKGLTDADFEIAAAKLRVGEAAGVATSIAHQVHGAIGFTERHPLHHSTLRLWAWREEFGSESEWAEHLGDNIIAGGAEALWPTLTGVGSELD